MVLMPTETRLHKLSSDIRAHLQLATGTLSYEERLKFQKITYLLQQWGLDYGYPFVWHYAGPFSFDLHFEYHDPRKYATPNQNQFDSQPFDEFKSFFGDKLTDANELELLASVLYLNNQYSCAFDPEKLVEIVKLRKPKYDEQEISDAISFLAPRFNKPNALA